MKNQTLQKSCSFDTILCLKWTSFCYNYTIEYNGIIDKDYTRKETEKMWQIIDQFLY